MSTERERMLRRIASALRKTQAGGGMGPEPGGRLGDRGTPEPPAGAVGQAASPADTPDAQAAGETEPQRGRRVGGPETRAPLGGTPAPPGPGGLGVKSLARRFSEELAALTGRAHVVASVDEAVSVIQRIVAATGTTRMLSWDAAELGEPDVQSRLVGGGLEVVRYELPADPEERRRALAELEPVQVGLTGATAGLADTGSIVLVSGPGRGRLVSLLPPVHIALLSQRRLYPSLPSFLEAHPDSVTQGSNFVIITGPSRTADIEMTLTHGVHGPREVHVILTP